MQSTPVQPIVRTLGFSIVPQDTRAAGTGARSTLPFQCCFAIVISPFVWCDYILTCRRRMCQPERK